MPTDEFFSWLRKKNRKHDPASAWSWTQWFDEMIRQFNAEQGGRR